MMFLDLKAKENENGFWKLANENHPQNYERPAEKNALPRHLLFFSKREDTETFDLIRWLNEQNYVVVVTKSFRMMHKDLQNFHREGKNFIALLIDVPPDKDNLSALDQKLFRLAVKWPQLRQVILAHRTAAIKERLGHLLRNGVIHDFHSLPVDRLRLLHCLGHLQGLVDLENSLRPVELTPNPKGYGELIGTSPPMQKIYSTIKRVSQVNTPVLITGESGTGKEVIARTIHKDSLFGKGPFVAINCAALPGSLIESELFGHEMGAFTGAANRKVGKVELADNGTLFLDEIGDMPVDLQTRFLRFLQNSSFERVGGLKSIKINARIIAATNVDLTEAIKRKTFREDVYYRLNVLSLHAPPLRNRCEDIRLLADSCLERFKETYKKPRLAFTATAYELMNKYAWPGNVRELISAVRRAAILARTRFIQPENLGLDTTLDHVRDAATSLTEARDDFDRQFIYATLTRNNFNISRAADELQISRVSLYRLGKRLDIPLAERGNRASARETQNV